ncbi:type II toxin-antitoxin system HicA family toxin [Faecalicatena faecalis]|uniref:type II toxin-antitoxin system HicA family toxin n=1 Tax=Faecalicatena faecalis TaxID=2726362 RepID=UPI002FE6CC23
MRGRYAIETQTINIKLEDAGFVFKEHGGNHDTFKRGSDIEQVPRHTEINEITAKRILRKWGLS